MSKPPSTKQVSTPHVAEIESAADKKPFRPVVVSIDDKQGHDVEEYRQIIATCPTLSDYIDVAWDEQSGRHLVAAKDLVEKECYLEESVLVSWPSLHDILGDEEVDREVYALEAEKAVLTEDDTEGCPNGHFEKIFCDLPWKDWALWQKEKSPQAAVNIVALASFLCQIAERSSSGILGLTDVLRPYERLCGLPTGSRIAFENATIGEIYGKLKKASGIHPFNQLSIWDDDQVGEALLENVAERFSQNAIGYGGSRRGVFVLLSLCNHDCVPNSEVEYVDSTTIQVSPMREIKKGQKLTINYCPTTLDHADRQQRLQHWHFECKCTRCELEGKLLANIDRPIESSAQSSVACAESKQSKDDDPVEPPAKKQRSDESSEG